MANEVAALNVDLIYEADGSLILASGTFGVVTSIASVANQTVNFVVASTTYMVKLEDLDFANGLVGIIRAFLLASQYTVEAIEYVESDQNYQGLIRLTLRDVSSTALYVTVESDRISGRLLFSFSAT